MVLALFSKLTSMMLFVIVGFILVRIHLLKVEDSQPLSTLMVYIMQPCLIINAFQIEITPERLHNYLIAIVFSSSAFILWILLTLILRKPLKLSPVVQATLAYPNVGNLILPVVSMVLGNEMVFYASAAQIPMNILFWTHGAIILQDSKKINWKKIFLNPNLIAVTIGLFLLVTRLKLPEVIATTITGFSNAVASVSMLMVGIVIAKSDLLDLVRFKKTYLVIFARQILCPLAVMLVLFLTGIPGRHPQIIPILTTSFIGLCAPPASSVSQVAILYDECPEEATRYNVMGMVFCVVTIPVMVACFQAVFG